MITVISPAKKLNFDETSPIKAFSQCQFLEDSKILVNQAKDYSFDEIMNLMGVSQNIANLTVQRFNDWNLPFTNRMRSRLHWRLMVIHILDWKQTLSV